MSETIIQALIVAGITSVATSIVTAVLTAYVNGRILEEKMRSLKEVVETLSGEIEKIRSRLHEWAPHIGWVEQQRRWDHDRRKNT